MASSIAAIRPAVVDAGGARQGKKLCGPRHVPCWGRPVSRLLAAFDEVPAGG